MKKFMKAIALATVMCLALSTVAFAANNVGDVAAKDATADHTVDVTVKGAASEEVALVIVASTEENEVTTTAGISDSNIVYIDQKTAAASGDTLFENVPIDSDVERVSVFVGYDGIAAADNYLGSFDIVSVKEITVVSRDVIVGTDGVGLMLEVAIPTGATKMIWSMNVAKDTNRRYSSIVDLTGITGSAKIGAHFANLTETDGVNNVGAIFWADGKDYYTNADLDKPNKN